MIKFMNRSRFVLLFPFEKKKGRFSFPIPGKLSPGPTPLEQEEERLEMDRSSSFMSPNSTLAKMLPLPSSVAVSTVGDGDRTCEGHDRDWEGLWFREPGV